MAHFYGAVQGSRSETSRLGSKKSGLSTVAASWQGAVEVYIYYDETTGKDIASVFLSPWHGKGISQNLYVGPVGGGENKTEEEQ